MAGGPRPVPDLAAFRRRRAPDQRAPGGRVAGRGTGFHVAARAVAAAYLVRRAGRLNWWPGHGYGAPGGAGGVSAGLRLFDRAVRARGGAGDFTGGPDRCCRAGFSCAAPAAGFALAVVVSGACAAAQDRRNLRSVLRHAGVSGVGGAGSRGAGLHADWPCRLYRIPLQDLADGGGRLAGGGLGMESARRFFRYRLCHLALFAVPGYAARAMAGAFVRGERTECRARAFPRSGDAAPGSSTLGVGHCLADGRQAG